MGVTVEKCLQAWTNSLRQMNAKADIVFFGDSLTYYGDFASAFPGKVVCNLGLRGDTIQGMIERIQQVRILKPERVYLMVGLNDVAVCRIDEFVNNYSRLVNALMNELKSARIYVQSMLPVNNVDFIISCNNLQIRTYNEAIRCIANKFGIPYLDLYSVYGGTGFLEKDKTIDGIHLKLESYQEWIHFLINNKILE